MSNDATPVKCKACNRVVRFDQMKYDDTKKFYVCQACYKESHRTPIKQQLAKAEPKKEQPKETAKTAKVKYLCGKCKYTFGRTKDKPISSCPYCGSSNVQPVSNQASKLISESDGYDF